MKSPKFTCLWQLAASISTGWHSAVNQTASCRDSGIIFAVVNTFRLTLGSRQTVISGEKCRGHNNSWETDRRGDGGKERKQECLPRLHPPQPDVGLQMDNRALKGERRQTIGLQAIRAGRVDQVRPHRKCWNARCEEARESLQSGSRLSNSWNTYFCFILSRSPSDAAFPSHTSPVICLFRCLPTLVAQLLLFNFPHPSRVSSPPPTKPRLLLLPNLPVLESRHSADLTREQTLWLNRPNSFIGQVCAGQTRNLTLVGLVASFEQMLRSPITLAIVPGTPKKASLNRSDLTGKMSVIYYKSTTVTRKVAVVINESLLQSVIECVLLNTPLMRFRHPAVRLKERHWTSGAHRDVLTVGGTNPKGLGAPSSSHPFNTTGTACTKIPITLIRPIRWWCQFELHLVQLNVDTTNFLHVEHSSLLWSLVFIFFFHLSTFFNTCRLQLSDYTEGNQWIEMWAGESNLFAGR